MKALPIVFAAIALVATACSTSGLPPDRAGPDVVLRAYLQALMKGDCSAGKTFGTPTFSLGNGELCGQSNVTSFTIDGAPAMPSADEADFATTLMTSGSVDGSVPAGPVIWFYDLKRQPDGSWRIVGGGSGP